MNNFWYSSKLFNYKLLMHFTKYSIVGILNAVLTITIYIVLLNVIRFDYLISFTLAWMIGVLFTYVVNFIYVFKPEEKLTFKKRLLKYFLVYLTSYIISAGLLSLLVDYFMFDPVISQFFVIPIIVAINFTGIKYWALV